MRNIWITSLLVIICNTVFSQNEETFFYNLNNEIKEYAKQEMISAIYLAPEKSIYSPGEKIRYVVMNMIPESSSIKDIPGLNICLLDPNGNIVSERTTSLSNSLSIDSFSLPPKLSSGIYNLTYFISTNQKDLIFHQRGIEIRENTSSNLILDIQSDFSKNSGKINISASNKQGEPLKGISIIASFYKKNKTIKLKSKTNDKGLLSLDIESNFQPFQIVSEAKYKNEKYNKSKIMYPQTNVYSLDFAVEGNPLVAGIPKLISVIALDTFKNPKEIEGQIVDDQGNSLANFKTDSNGKGYFYLAAKDQAMHAIVGGSDTKFKFPKVAESGGSISLIKFQNDSVFFRLENALSNEIQKFKIALMANYNIIWGNIATIKQAGIIKLPTTDIPSGIAKVLVYNDKDILIAERTIYIENKSSEFAATLEKNVFSSQEPVVVSIKNKGDRDLKGTLLVSNEEVFTNFPEATAIFKYPIVSQNKIDLNKELVSNQNLLLLPDKNNSKTYNKKMGLAGFILNKKDEPIADATITILKNSKDTVYNIKSDENGWFQTDSLNTRDEYSILATKNNKKCKVLLVDVSKLCVLNYHKNNYVTSRNYEIVDQNIFLNDKKQLLKLSLAQNDFVEELIKSTNKEPNREREYDPSKTILQIISEIKPYIISDNRIIFHSGITSYKRVAGAVFVIDGSIKGESIGAISYLTTNDVQKIRILTTPDETALYTSFAPNGIIEITTKGKFNDVDKKYTGDSKKSYNTLLQNVVLSDHESKKVIFFPKNESGAFWGNIIGVSKNGNIINQSFTFNVLP